MIGVAVAVCIALFSLPHAAVADDPGPIAASTELERQVTMAGINLDYAEHCGLGAADISSLSPISKTSPIYMPGRSVPADQLKALHDRFVVAFNHTQENWTIWFERDNCPIILHKAAIFPVSPAMSQ